MTILTSNPTSVAVEGGALPAWASGMTVGTWYPVSGSGPSLGLSATNSPIDPTTVPEIPQPSVGSWGTFEFHFSAWNGAIFAPTVGASGSWILWGGGHGDYYGNLLTRWDVSTRTWSILAWPTASGPMTSGTSLLPYGEHPDGSPGVPHTYYACRYDWVNDAFLGMRAHDELGSGSGITVPHSADLAIAVADPSDLANIWSRLTNGVTTTYSTNGSATWFCDDTTRGVVWKHDKNGDFESFNLTTNTWGNQAAGPGVYDLYNFMGHDPVNDTILMFDGDFSDIWKFKPSNLTTRTSVRSALSSAPIVKKSNLLWSSQLGGFVYLVQGTGDVYLIETTNDYESGNTVTQLNTNNPLPTTSQGNFSKPQIAEYGSTVIAMCAPTSSGPMYAVRLS